MTVLAPVNQPVAAHPENGPRLRALLDEALELTERWWSPEARDQVAEQLQRDGMVPDVDHETASALAILVTPQDGELLRLPFPVEERIVVDRTFAVRPLLAGLARRPRYRVLVLDGHRATLFEGHGEALGQVTDHGFPVEVAPTHEPGSPHRDLPIHERIDEEEHHAVCRAVDAALDALVRRDPVPLVVAAPERELSSFEEVTSHADTIVGTLRGNWADATSTALAEAAGPVLDERRAADEARLAEHLREAHGRERAVFGLHAVQEAAEAGRGHLLAVEEGFTFPREWADGLTAGAAPDEPLQVDDLVDEVIEQVLLAGGDVEVLDDGALTDRGRIGLLLRY